MKTKFIKLLFSYNFWRAIKNDEDIYVILQMHLAYILPKQSRIFISTVKAIAVRKKILDFLKHYKIKQKPTNMAGLSVNIPEMG